MKNLNYFPCERNRYYYGKLLGVEDFEAEQRYMNDKRRLINRFMHGCGVVCGMNVVPIADDAVSVEPGLALDFAGREIVVDEPYTRRIQEIEGFSDYEDSGERSGYLYLCIEYAEYEKDVSYNIAGSDSEYNRIAEGYRLYLTSQEPEQGISGSAAYYEEKETLYWGNGVRISQIFPRYAKSGAEFDARIVVENMGQKQPILFHYELRLEGIRKDEKSWLIVDFDETKYEKARRYELELTFTAGNANGIRGSAKVTPESFALWVGDEAVEAKVSCENTVEIVKERVESVISRRYFAEAMREIRKETYHQSIYLAKISLFEAGDVIIDDIEEMPFGQYICSDVLSGIRDLAEGQEQKYVMRRIERNRQAVMKERPKAPEHGEYRSAFGTVEIELGMGGLTGKRFFSEPIVHGLGPGNVTLVFGLVDREKKPSAVYYGESEVFGEFVCEVQGKLAAKVDVEAGTFVLGLKLTAPTSAERVKLCWAAFRDGAKKTVKREERTLFLKPDMVYLSLREDCRFEPVMTDRGDRLEWSVAEPEGGSIDSQGQYTAPSVPGIYQIIARSTAHPGLKASAYVVVRE